MCFRSRFIFLSISSFIYVISASKLFMKLETTSFVSWWAISSVFKKHNDEPRFAVLSVGFEFRLGTVLMAEKLALKSSVLSSEDELVLRSMNLSFWSAQMTSQTF